THEGLSDVSAAALEATDHVFAVATPDRPSLVNLGRYLATLERLGMAAGNISVVLNKAEADTGLDAVDMAAELGRRFDAVVPYSPPLPRSLNAGVPPIAGGPKSPIAKVRTGPLAAVMPRAPRAEPAPVTPLPVPSTAVPPPVARPLPARGPVP